MNEALLNSITDAERETAASLNEAQGISPIEVVRGLFGDVLDDPLLTVEDIAELTNLDADVLRQSVLPDLLQEAFLESDQETQRPFDPAETTLYRAADGAFQRLRCVALESLDREGTSSYQTTIDGRILRHLAQVDRLDALTGEGVQRDELLSHAKDIAEGVRAGKRIPNAVLLVILDDAVQHINNDGTSDDEDEDDEIASFITVRPLMDGWLDVPHPAVEELHLQSVRLVELSFPYRAAAFDREKNAVIVDGQQRTAALSLVSIDDIPVVQLSVNLVIGNAEEAKDVFRIANNSKPIKTDFKLALLATMTDPVGFLPDDRVPALALRDIVITNAASPFYGIVKYPGLESRDLPIAYNTLFKAVELFSDSDIPGTDEPVGLASVFTRVYASVRASFPHDWGLTPKESKLMAGVGLRSLNGVMKDYLLRVVGDSDSITEEHWTLFDEFVLALANKVSWSAAGLTSGATEERAKFFAFISDKQNTSADIAKVTKKLNVAVKAIIAERRRSQQ